MAYDPLAPYLPLGATLTPDHIAHLDRGIQESIDHAEDLAQQVQAGKIVVTEAPDVPGAYVIGE